MARFMISTDVTEWKVLVAATMTMTRILPTQKDTHTHSARTHTQVGIQITTMQKDKNQIRGSLDYLSQSSFTCMIFLFNTHCMSEV